ncbi:MAG: 2,5-diamino-6-(ribosylamino)-4(3H)-pyrimidinone 5'-phosphate reductase [Acidobacteria bacterium]|nr:MAG: 2,5-diamino-6-(ribosylamino)-4(3H)-pyrimidinone 5'-phosphate reductase [Acidobacteriota bacterium]
MTARGRGSRRVEVVGCVAVSADGKIDSARREGGGFQSRLDRDRLDALRAQADALVVGARTIRAEDPPFRVRDPARRHRRRELGRPEQPLVVVVSRSGRIPADARVLREPAGGRLLAMPRDAPAPSPELETAVRQGLLEIVRCGERDVALDELLDELARRDVRRVLVEGGGETLAGFVEQDLLDELCVTVCPVLLGGRDAPTAVEGRGLPVARRRHLELLELERAGGELFLRYRVGRGG